jgi:hypothetical protein
MLRTMIILYGCLNLFSAQPQQDRNLKMNESVSFKVKAKEPYNRAGIQLQKEQLYEITAVGEWKDGSCSTTDAAGFKASNCGSPLPDVDLLMSSMEELRRDKHAQWLCLTAGIFDQPSNSFENIIPDQQFSVGRSIKIKPAVTGKLVLFANDVMTGYGNNTGQLTVTVKRIQ